METQVTGWFAEFDERQQKEIELAMLYARDYHHGTNGHNDLMIIAQMARLLNEYEHRNDLESVSNEQ